MKLHNILLACCILMNATCISQQKTIIDKNKSSINKTLKKIDKIIIIEKTRGTNRSITFDTGSIITSLNENISKSELSSSEWEDIVKQASLIDLSKIASYESPTTGRFSDSALASTIIITSNGKTYQSASFDAGIPPKELEGLYRLLKSKSGITKRREPKLR